MDWDQYGKGGGGNGKKGKGRGQPPKGEKGAKAKGDKKGQRSRYNRHVDDDSEDVIQAMQMLSVGADDNSEESASGGWTSQHLRRDAKGTTRLRSRACTGRHPCMGAGRC